MPTSRRLSSGLGMVAAAVLLTGCGFPDKNPTQSGPDYNTREAVKELKVSGNSYDRQNELGVIFPKAERINVSYEFIMTVQDKELEIPGQGEGRIWWFAREAPLVPEQFLALHLYQPDAGYEIGPGDLIKLARRNFTSQEFCVHPGGEDPGPPITNYLSDMKERGFTISDDVYVRRIASKVKDGQEERTDLIYVRDIVRLGYSCEQLGTPTDPRTEAMQNVYEILKKESERSFEIMG